MNGDVSSRFAFVR